MAADISKHLERAKRFLEKNRVEDAIEAYLAVIEAAPQHQEATQALGDLYARMEQPDRAAVYYGMLFDLLVEPRDEIKALAIYNRFLRPVANQQPPERIARYAFLQQKQNRYDEAIEQYSRAAEMFSEAGRAEDALFCWERTAQLAPDNIQRQLRLAEAAEKLKKTALAARAYLRAGQLASASGATADALKFLGHAYGLAPHERGGALLYADATLKSGDAATAAQLLEPFAANEKDATFLDTFADALMSSGQLDRARVVLEGLLREKNEGITRLFELVDGYVVIGQEGKAVEVLNSLKRRMFADKKQNEFAAQMDGIGTKHPDSLSIVEFWAQLYNELNRESQYFEILIKLFDAHFAAGNIPKACDTIEKLIDIDSYDHRNQERIAQLQGKADESFFRRIGGRIAKSGGLGSAATPAARPAASDAGSAAPGDEARKTQALEDLIVQTEIFLQYSLQAKAMERLQKIAAMFPGEEERYPRLRNLYEMANWWPEGAPKAKPALPPAAAPPPPPPAPVVQQESRQEPIASSPNKTGTYTADTLRDLSKISEINQKIFRQQTPRAMLNTAVNEVGGYLRTARALAVIGAPGRPPELAAEYCAQGLRTAPGAQVVLLLAQMEKAEPDELGGLTVNAADGSILRDLGLETALGVMITDKETQVPSGMLIVGHSSEHKWKPNEAYFLQAIGDQMLMSVSHTRLRSLVRRMGVSDERTGWLSRSSYKSFLLAEAERARTQSTPLSLAILQIDHGA